MHALQHRSRERSAPLALVCAQEFASKQLKELKNGRLAMIAVLGEMMAQQVSGLGTYEQLGLIVKGLPLPF